MQLECVLRVEEDRMKDQNVNVTVVDTQRYVALDLEYNQPSGTIIQVGGRYWQRFAKRSRVHRSTLGLASQRIHQ